MPSVFPSPQKPEESTGYQKLDLQEIVRDSPDTRKGKPCQELLGSVVLAEEAGDDGKGDLVSQVPKPLYQRQNKAATSASCYDDISLCGRSQMGLKGVTETGH